MKWPKLGHELRPSRLYLAVSMAIGTPPIKIGLNQSRHRSLPATTHAPFCYLRDPLESTNAPDTDLLPPLTLTSTRGNAAGEVVWSV